MPFYSDQQGIRIARDLYTSGWVVRAPEFPSGRTEIYGPFDTEEEAKAFIRANREDLERAAGVVPVSASRRARAHLRRIR
jgi:hypothetical protein